MRQPIFLRQCSLHQTWKPQPGLLRRGSVPEKRRADGEKILFFLPGLISKKFRQVRQELWISGVKTRIYSEIAALTSAEYRNGTAACVKHFAANNQETERLWVDVRVDERCQVGNLFLHFTMLLRNGGAACVMAAYNRLYGRHCSMNHYLLQRYLKGRMGLRRAGHFPTGEVYMIPSRQPEGELDIEMSVTNDFDNYLRISWRLPYEGFWRQAAESHWQ